VAEAARRELFAFLSSSIHVGAAGRVWQKQPDVNCLRPLAEAHAEAVWVVLGAYS